MARLYKLPKITEEEELRLVEIQFYLIIRNMFDTLGNKVSTWDLLEQLCICADISILTIKTIVKDIMSETSVLKPNKEELSILLYKAGWSISKIERTSGYSARHFYRILNTYVANDFKQPYISHLKRHEEIEQFIKFTKGLFNYDEYSI